MKQLLIITFLLFPFLLIAQSNDFSKGLNFDDAAYEKVEMKAPLVRSLYGSKLPASASLKDYSPYPKSQGSYGTCVGWATNYAALTIAQAYNNKLTDRDLITSKAYAPGFVYHFSKSASDRNCSYGTYIDKAFDIMKEKGTLYYSDFNESCPGTVSKQTELNAVKNKIENYARIFSGNSDNKFKIEATKKSLSQNRPVVIGMKCPKSFHSPKGVWQPTENPNGNFGGHAMCVIGYDNNKYGGAFEIQNSWGDWWGNSGYIWVKYNDYANFTKYAYELISGIKTKKGEKKIFSGEVVYRLNNGNEMPASYHSGKYILTQTYSPGTRFRIYISNNEPAYVYAFGSDNTGKAFPIFPYAKNISPVLNYSKNEIAIPDENHSIELDNTTGKNYLCVLYSKKPLDLDALCRDFENSKGFFVEKVRSIVGDDLLTNSEIKFSKNGKIEFTAKSESRNVMALIVEINNQ